jgi:hypothetical protein
MSGSRAAYRQNLPKVFVVLTLLTRTISELTEVAFDASFSAKTDRCLQFNFPVQPLRRIVADGDW